MTDCQLCSGFNLVLKLTSLPVAGCAMTDCQLHSGCNLILKLTSLPATSCTITDYQFWAFSLLLQRPIFREFPIAKSLFFPTCGYKISQNLR